jgi:hypothetical protein
MIIKPGMKFRFKSKHDNSYYVGIVASILLSKEEYVTFFSDRGILYRSSEVEWLRDIRDLIIKEILD